MHKCKYVDRCVPRDGYDVVVLETAFSCLANFMLFGRSKCLVSAIFLTDLLDGILFICQTIESLYETMS